MIPRGFGIAREKPPDGLGRRTKVVLDSQRGENRPRAPSLKVGNIRRKLRAEDEHAVARVEHRLGEILLERLGTRTDDDILGRDRITELTRDEPRRRRAKTGQTQARTVARLVIFDRLDSRLFRVRSRGKRAVADLQLDNVFPLGAKGPRGRQHRESRFGRQIPSERAEPRHEYP